MEFDEVDDDMLETSLVGIRDETARENIRKKVRLSPPKEKLNVLRDALNYESGREIVNAQRNNTSAQFDAYISETIKRRNGAIGSEPTSNQIIDLAVKRYLLDGINPVKRIRKLQEPYQNDPEGADARNQFVNYVRRKYTRIISKLLLIILSSLLLATSAGIAIWGLTTQMDIAMISAAVLSIVAFLWILILGTLYFIYNTTTYAVLTGVGSVFAGGAAVAWFFAPMYGVPIGVLSIISLVFIIVIALI